MNLAIVGSRSLNIDLNKFITQMPDKIITGDAYGVDRSARIFAIEHNIELKIFKPDYFKFRKSAPIIRNINIVNSCDKLIAFWDGKSYGTMHAVKIANKKNKQIKVFIVKNNSISLFFKSNVQMTLI